jgi:hypothetical protein
LLSADDRHCRHQNGGAPCLLGSDDHARSPRALIS